ncbi:MAG: nodulation protein NfeD [Spirochaetes bacterium]|nr:nodulation protein NfeD [Spirochaetota bacterium]
MKRIILILSLIFILHPDLYAKKSPSKAYILQCNGIINSVMASHITYHIKKTEEQNDGFIILLVDTPGGLLDSMRDISLSIMNSTVPVIGFVYPEGARAASAGAFIILSCDKAAMAPTSNIGSAHPVNLGQKMDKTMEAKVVNDTVAFITGIAKKRGKNQAIAKKMVTKSISLTSKEAYQNNIIDHIALDPDALIKKLDHVKIKKNDRTIILRTDNVIKEAIRMNVLEKFLFKISHPNIAYILLILGIYGIIAEFSSPGIGFPGVLGGISLVLAFFSLNTLPINIAGLILIILSVILLILELNIQSGGILGIGSVVSFILGSIMLIRSSAVFLKISPSLIISFSIFSAVITILILIFGIRIQFTRPKTGREGLIGSGGIAKTDIKPAGTVFVSGELWQARSFQNQQIKKGDTIEVVDIKHLLLIVKKVSE